MIFTPDEISSLCCANQTCDDEATLNDCIERITDDLNRYDLQEIDGVKIATTRYKGYTLIVHAYIPPPLQGEDRLKDVIKSLPQPVLYQPYMRQYASLIGKPIPKIIRLSYPSGFWHIPDSIMSYFLVGSKKTKYTFPTLYKGDTVEEFVAMATPGVEMEMQAYYYAKHKGLI